MFTSHGKHICIMYWGQGQDVDCVDVMGSALCVVGKYLCPAASPRSAENPVAPP